MKTNPKSEIRNSQSEKSSSTLRQSGRLPFTVFNLSMLLLFLSPSAHASTMVWTNSAGGLWSTAANWSPNQVPGSSDTAVITNGGNYTVVLDANALVAGLMLGGGSGTQMLYMTNSAYTLMKPSGQVEIAGGGVLRMEAGDLSGAITVTNGGQLVFAGDSTKYLYGTKLNNAGTILWTNAGSLLAYYAGDVNLEQVFITNLSGGTFEIAGDAVLDYVPSGWNLAYGFHNAGTLLKSGGTGATSIGAQTTSAGLVFKNLGNIVVQQGSLVFSNGFANNGAFHLATNTTARLDAGTFLFDPGSHAIGPGQLLISRDTAVTVTVTGTIPSLTWSSGVVRGTFTVASDATLTINGNATKYLDGTKINNAGTIFWTGTGNLTPVFEGQDDLRTVLITNLPGATFEIAGDAALNHGDLSWKLGYVFNNAGTLRKTANAGTTTFDDFLQFYNSGNVEVLQGTLSLPRVENTGSIVAQSAISFRGGLTNNGVLNLSSNVVVDLSGGAFTFGPNSQVLGEGLFRIPSGSVVVQGMLSRLEWSGGTLLNSTITVPSNGLFTITGSATKTIRNSGINNYGTLLWSGVGDLLAYSTGVSNRVPITNFAGGVFDIQTDADVNYNSSGGFDFPFLLHNAGTLRKSAGAGTNVFSNPLEFISTGQVDVQTGALSFVGTVVQSDGALNFGITSPTIYGKLIVPSQASIRGIIRAALINPTGLSAGNSFPVLNQGLRLRNAVVFAGRNLGEGLVYEPVLDASAVKLVLRAATHPASPVLSLSYTPQLPAFVLVEGPAGGSYRFELSTNLNDWTRAETNSAPDGVWEFSDEDAASFPVRFYRAITQ